MRDFLLNLDWPLIVYAAMCGWWYGSVKVKIKCMKIEIEWLKMKIDRLQKEV